MPTTDSNDLQRVLELCDEALAKPPEERDSFLSESCGGDLEIRKAVDKLLISVGNADQFLDPVTKQDQESLIGEHVGDYRILERLGEGGMGSVYLAEREGGDFEQRVAIKMVRRFVMNEELIQRFDSERQLLAQLHHPYIAQLIDGGTTKDGVPYLVMEYIEGVQIDVYCDQKKLGLNQRIKLIKKVAMAVQAAHQNLIVHRDLKPANVLITHDGIPKLLDFGIAKLVDPSRQPTSGHTTMFGHMPMTPDYSSPEQILEGTVTTAGDVYSLGVLSYELLTGKRPYELSSSSHPQLMKSVESLVIEKPSEYFRRQTGNQTQIWASSRSTVPQTLAKQLNGDLDRILLKALHKDPARRYESVGAFAKDFDRYLTGLPVEARDDTLGYRVSKFVTRNKLTVGAATVTMMAVLAAFGVSLWQAGIARDQSQKAQAQLVRAEAVSSFLGDILLSPSMNWDGVLQTGPVATIADVLVAAETKLDSGLTEYPKVRLELYYKIGEAFSEMQLYEASIRVQRKAVALADSALPASSPLRVDALYFLGTALLDPGVPEDTDSAIDILDRALKLADQQSSELSLRKLYIMNDLAMGYAERHEFERALVIMHQTVDGSFEVLGPGLKPPHSLVYANLATTYISLGRFTEGRKHLETGMEAYRLFPDQTESIGAVIYERLARLDIIAQSLSDAQDKYRQAITLYNNSYGIPSPHAGESTMRLAHLLAFTGDYAGAREHLDHAELVFADYLDLPVSWPYYVALAHWLLVQGENSEALANARKALEFGYEIEMSRFDRTDATWLLVRALVANGDIDEAKLRHKELVEVESAWIPDDAPYKQRILSQTF